MIIYLLPDYIEFTAHFYKTNYTFFKTAKDIEGDDSRIYRKALLKDGSDKEKRTQNGAKWKAEIVKNARMS